MRRGSSPLSVGPFDPVEKARRLPVVRLVGPKALVTAWRRAFAGTPVEVQEGDILSAAAGQSIVSPANSFGDMGGGLDRAIRHAYRPYPIEDAVRAAIAREADGELVVGQSLVVPTPGQRFAHLVVAPTMRTPQVVRGTVNAYLAFRAALLAAWGWNAARRGEAVSVLFCPGLGTGVGKLDPVVAAEQMRAAWDAVCRPPAVRSLIEEALVESRLKEHTRTNTVPHVTLRPSWWRA